MSGEPLKNEVNRPGSWSHINETAQRLKFCEIVPGMPTTEKFKPNSRITIAEFSAPSATTASGTSASSTAVAATATSVTKAMVTKKIICVSFTNCSSLFDAKEKGGEMQRRFHMANVACEPEVLKPFKSRGTCMDLDSEFVHANVGYSIAQQVGHIDANYFVDKVLDDEHVEALVVTGFHLAGATAMLAAMCIWKIAMQRKPALCMKLSCRVFGAPFLFFDTATRETLTLLRPLITNVHLSTDAFPIANTMTVCGALSMDVASWSDSFRTGALYLRFALPYENRMSILNNERE